MSASNIIESFFVALGFEVDPKGLDEMKKKTEELRDSALKLGAIFTGAAAGIGLLVQGVASSLGDLYSFSELNNMSARSVAALGKIATENDGSLEGMKSTIQSINKVIGEASLGIGRGAMTFEKLGLAAKGADGKVKSVDELLGDVADKMQGLSRQEQIAMAEKLGIDPQFVKVLERGSANLAKLREEAEMMNPFTEKDYELADQVDKLFIKAKGTLGVFTKMLGVALLPTVKEVLQNYMEWFKASRKATSDTVIRGLKFVAGALGTVWDWVVRLVSGTKSLIDWFRQFEIVTYLAAGALAVFISVKTYDFLLQIGAAMKMLILRMATFNATALLVPAIIGAVALALGALIDDYVNWKEGNESIIGDLVQEFPMLLDIITAVEEAVGAVGAFWLQQWKTLGPPLTELGRALWKLGSIVVQTLWPVVKMVFTGWAYIMAAIIPIVASIVGWLAERLVAGIRLVIQTFTVIVGTVTKVYDAVVSVFTSIGAVIQTAKKWVEDFVASIEQGITKLGELAERANVFNRGVNAVVEAATGEKGQTLGGLIYDTLNSEPNSTPATPLDARRGVLGTANNTNSSSTVTQSTQITAPITINSPDPSKAGESVRQELEKMNRQTVRNGQSAVAL